MPDDEQLYIVTAYIDGQDYPASYHVAGESASAAEATVEQYEDVESVLSDLTEPFSGKFEVTVEGSPGEISRAVEHLDHLATQADADMNVRDVTPTIWPAGDDLDDDDALNVAVEDWDDLELRIMGTDIYDDEEDREGTAGVLSSTPAAMQAREDSTVEVVAGNKVLVKAILDNGVPQLTTKEEADD